MDRHGHEMERHGQSDTFVRERGTAISIERRLISR
jgi:hypothetical protein